MVHPRITIALLIHLFILKFYTQQIAIHRMSFKYLIHEVIIIVIVIIGSSSSSTISIKQLSAIIKAIVSLLIPAVKGILFVDPNRCLRCPSSTQTMIFFVIFLDYQDQDITCLWMSHNKVLVIKNPKYKSFQILTMVMIFLFRHSVHDVYLNDSLYPTYSQHVPLNSSLFKVALKQSKTHTEGQIRHSSERFSFLTRYSVHRVIFSPEVSTRNLSQVYKLINCRSYFKRMVPILKQSIINY